MHIKTTRARPLLADVLARLVTKAWSGTPAELHAALEAEASPLERAAAGWPRSPVALAAILTSETDEMRERGLRLSRFPCEILVERLRPPRVATAA